MSPLKLSISQIAKEAGVSPSTVSRVVNQHPDVSEKTRKRVMEVVERFSFRPDAAARSLITQRTHTLALVASDIDRFSTSVILAETERLTRSLGYKLYFNMVEPDDVDQAIEVMHELLAYRVDGIIWAIKEMDHTADQIADILTGLPMPVMCVSANLQNPLPAVICDNHLGGYLATDHLLQQGYRHIGIITGPSRMIASNERLRGWDDALQTAGIEPQPRQVVAGDWTAVSGKQGLYTLMQQFPELDAVFVANDQMAIGVLKAAHNEGWQVPERLGIVSFDNIPESECFIPALTTINNPFSELAQAGVKQLDRMLRARNGAHTNSAGDRSNPFRVILQPEIVIRQSSVRR